MSVDFRLSIGAVVLDLGGMDPKEVYELFPWKNAPYANI